MKHALRPLLRVILPAMVVLLLQPELFAQRGLHIGAESGWTMSWIRFNPGDGEVAISLESSHGYLLGPQLFFTVTSEQSQQSAYVLTGFRIRRERLRAQLTSVDGIFETSDQMALIEIPIGFSYRQPFARRFSAKQEFGLTLQVLSAGDNSLASGPRPAFVLSASPDRSFVPSLYTGAGFEWESRSGLILELTAEYHQGLGGGFNMGSVEYRTPDEQILLPFFSDASYLAVHLGFHLPASGLGELFRPSERNPGGQL